MEHPFRMESHSLAKLLLQASVVALGFGMNLKQVVHAGRSGFFYTAVSITCAMLLGLLFGSLLKVAGKASFLISAGTAICGGSAIAAISPITGADEEEISVSMGTVFLLNSIALLVFPAIGHGLHLSQDQFGLWSALAIHDTSSVVGAAAKYGNQALAVGTTVKLARALWIVPVSLLAAVYMTRTKHSHGPAQGQGPLVHLPFLPCGRRSHILPPVRRSVWHAESSRQGWPDGHAVSDRNQSFEKHAAAGWSAALPSGHHPMDHRCRCVPGRDLLQLYSDLNFSTCNGPWDTANFNFACCLHREAPGL